MADFRKISVLVALVLLLGVSASAQQTSPAGPFTCIANAAVPPTVRAEGLTELVGDIVLTCTGGVPTAAAPAGSAANNAPRVNFTVFLNTSITSRIYTTTGESEVLMIVDEPGTNTNASPLLLCTTPTTGCNVEGRGTVDATTGIIVPGPEPYDGLTRVIGSGGTARTANGYNVFRGIVTGNQVQFIGVPVDAPGTAFQRVFRITNIRANASGISAGASGLPGSLQALISASGSTSVPITNPTNIVGFVQNGLAFTTRRASDFTAQTNTNTHIGFAQCASLSRTTTTGYHILEFREGFPTAFKPRGVQGAQATPGAIYNTESGFTSIAAGMGANNYGFADSGTRFKATITNIPAGVSLYASTTAFFVAANASAAGKLVSGEVTAADVVATNTDFRTRDSGGSGPVGASTTRSGAQLAVVNGSATAVWEVTAAGPLEVESFYTLLWFNYSQAATQNSPPPGSANINGSFAPTQVGTGATAAQMSAASQTLPIPRFVESVNSRAIFTVYLCRTNLLFPFVTNKGGFDTGLAIANTSLDTGVFRDNTATQTGACNIFPFGDDAPASFSTGTVAPGKVWVDTASTKLPNFQGYIIAQCAFQLAHGFAFISDFGARNLAMGYLALIIPDRGVDSRDVPAAGESLDQ